MSEDSTVVKGPALYIGFSSTTCFVTTTDAAKAAYTRSEPARRALYIVKTQNAFTICGYSPKLFHCSFTDAGCPACTNCRSTPQYFHDDVSKVLNLFIQQAFVLGVSQFAKSTFTALKTETPFDIYVSADATPAATVVNDAVPVGTLSSVSIPNVVFAVLLFIWLFVEMYFLYRESGRKPRMIQWNKEETIKESKWIKFSGLFFLSIVTSALIYDNIIIAIGSNIGVGDYLRALSYGRFILHGLCTPLLILECYYILERTGDELFSARRYPAAVLFTIVFIIIGLAEIGYGENDLLPNCSKGLIRFVAGIVPTNQQCDEFEYPAVMKAASPPIGAILTIITIIFFGIRMAYKSKHFAMVFGAIVMIICAGVPTSVGGVVVGNAGEVFLILCILIAHQYVYKKTIAAQNQQEQSQLQHDPVKAPEAVAA